MTEPYYDVCVIGGGINGAGVAQAAAAHGYSVLVLEKTALASGTSSRSSKLIHGGLRYLETGQISLVWESLREREILLNIAPHLVYLQDFNIPVYKNTSRRPWQLQVGLSLYALLGGLGKQNRFCKVPRQGWDQLDGLSTDHLVEVFRYRDAQTDDAQLTRAVMNSALQLGAELLMPACFSSAHLDSRGLNIAYERDGSQHSCHVAAMVNAAGPWVDQVARSVEPVVRLPATDLVQGAHLIVAGSVTQGMYYLEAPRDHRAVFVMPWKEHTMVGTTETMFDGNPDKVVPTAGEEEYLLKVLRHYFPRFQDQQQGSIQSSFAGLRVLPSGSGGAFRRSRETLLATQELGRSRIVTILGGKLTVYRATAEKVIQQLVPVLPKVKSRADTRRLVLPEA